MLNAESPAFVSSEANLPNSSPGLHILANLHVTDAQKLLLPGAFQLFVRQLVQEFELRSVGEVFHQFENGAFTGVVCLTESHLSIHTWPEKDYLTFDIFLSSHLRDNRGVTRLFYNRVVDYFNATILAEQFIER